MPSIPITYSACALVALWIASSMPLAADDHFLANDHWAEFRGSQGNGQAVAAKPAMTWSESSNVRWKTPIHGRGWSSPVIWDDQIWMTTATEDGKQMFAICVERTTGKILHDLLIFENDEPRFCHPTNSYASPTPAIERGRVYVHFGSYGTACVDSATGQILWQRRDLECNHWRGPGASPILHQGSLFVAFDGYDKQYVVAFDKQTGKTVWRRERNIDYRSDNGDHKKAYGTALVINHNGREQLISPSAAETIAYDPKTGAELWRVRHGGMNAATRPVFSYGLVYITNGDPVGATKTSLLAVRPDGQGDVSESHVAWIQSKGVCKRPSPLVVDDSIFMISDDGVASCLDAHSGEIIWRKRLGGNYRASPVLCDGRIYCFSLDGEMPVFRASRDFDLMATNQLDHGCQASPAVADHELYIRTTRHLYCIAP